MKAVSLWQPHASLLVLPNPATGRPFKGYETRGWKSPATIMGQRIAIHAAKNRSDLLWLEESFARGHYDEFTDAIQALGFKHPFDMPTGAIVGTAVITGWIIAEAVKDDPFGDFGPGRFAWTVEDPRPLPQPVPWKGAQGIFEIPDEVIGHG